MKRKIGAGAFIETSAKENEHIDEVIHTAIRLAAGKPIKNASDDSEDNCCGCF